MARAQKSKPVVPANPILSALTKALKTTKAEKVPKNPKPKAIKENVNVSIDGKLHVSTVEHPCTAMFNLCDELVIKKSMKRKDVLIAAQKAGIAFWTARTQYQAWLTAYNNGKK